MKALLHNTILSLAVLSFGLVNAKGKDENSNVARTKTVEIIGNILKNANKKHDKLTNGVAIVTIKVENNGKLKIIETNTPDASLQHFIEANLNTLNIPKNSYKPGEEHTIRVIYKTL